MIPSGSFETLPAAPEAPSDAAARFGDLFMEQRPHLLRVAGKAAGDWQGAEDIVQEAAVDAWRARDRFEDQGDGMRPWLHTITRNRAINRAQYEGRRPSDPTDPYDYAYSSVPDDTYQPEQAVLREDSLDRIRAAAGKLPPQFAEVILAVYVDGESLGEWGDRNGISPGTQVSRHARAKAKLRELVEAGEVDLGNY